MNERQAYRAPIAPSALSVIMALSPISVDAAAPSEACSLVSDQEVSTAAGFVVAPGDKTFKTICSWYEPGKGSGGRNVEVSYLTERVFEAGKTMAGATIQSEAGLGDEAYFIIQEAGVPRLEDHSFVVLERRMARS